MTRLWRRVSGAIYQDWLRAKNVQYQRRPAGEALVRPIFFKWCAFKDNQKRNQYSKWQLK